MNKLFMCLCVVGVFASLEAGETWYPADDWQDTPDPIASPHALTVESYVDFGTHGMFICAVDEAVVLSDEPTMTYACYHANVKPKPQTAPGAPKRWICPICGYVYEGEGRPPADYIYPLCKHPDSEFVEE